MSERFNFTQAAIEAIAVPSKRTRFYDQGGRSSVRGLTLMVWPTGGRVFYFYRKFEGRPIDIKIGAFEDITIGQAREKAEAYNAAVGRGEDPRKESGRPKAEWAFRDLFAWWLEDCAKARRKSWREDQDVFRRYLSPIAPLALSKLAKADLRRLHAELGANVGQRTANKALELVRAVINAGIRHDKYHGANPTLAVEMFEMQSRERRLMPGEMAAFFQALGEEQNEDIRDYITMSLLTGARQMNVLAARWCDIDLTARVWCIPAAESKGGRPMILPLEDGEVELLERRRARHGKGEWVFPGRAGSKHGHLIEPKSGWARILRRASEIRAAANEPPLSDLRLHDLRRTLGSNMVDTGASLPMIGRALGHQSQAATGIYARLSLEPVREAKRAAHGAMLAATSNIVPITTVSTTTPAPRTRRPAARR